MDIVSSFRLNKGKTFSSNIQYAVFLLKDRMLFIKIGGEFADIRFILSWALFALLIGITVGIIVGLIVSKLSLPLVAPGVGIGIAIGFYTGAIMSNKIIKPNSKKALLLKNLSVLSQDELLAMDKNNFLAYYKDIPTISYHKSNWGMNGPCVGLITIGKDRYEIAPGQNYEEIILVINNLFSDRNK